MAQAVKNVRTRIVQRPVTIECVRVNLDLNIKEAEFLLFLLDRVAGDPAKSPRKFADTINTALRNASIADPGYTSDACESPQTGRPVIMFKDNANTPEKRRLKAAYYEYPEGLLSADSSD